MSDKPQDTVTLTIDGKQVSVPKGTLVVQAAATVGIEIPVFCSHPKLEPLGACRMCLVRVEKIPKLITACTLTVAEGMVVTTNSPEVAAARAGVLEFLLSNHPLDCPFCDKAGECDLQDHAYHYGGASGRFEERKNVRGKKLLAPIIEKVMSRCVQCARCVRYCDEVMGIGALRFANRGVRAEVSTFNDGPLDCELCGNCIEVCPTGALTSEFYDMKSRPLDRKTTHSVCQYCGDGCAMSLETKGRFSGETHVLRTRGVEGRGTNEEFLCVRGRFGYGIVNSPERLRQPLVRRDGKLGPASWEEALEVVASRLKEIKTKHGADAIGGIGSEKVTNEEAYLFGKLLRGVLGTNNVDYRTGGKAPFRAASLARLLQMAPPEGALKRVERAGLTVLLGSDITAENPWLEKQIVKAVKKNRGKQILAYPRKIAQAKYASQWLRHAPGAEEALLRGLADLVAGEGSAEKAGPAAGAAPAELAAFAKQMQDAPDVVLILGPNVTAGADPNGAMDAAADLANALRAAGKERVHVVVQALHNNTRGAQDMGLLPDSYPGYAGLAADAVPAWGKGLPVKPGKDTVSMLEAAASGGLKALYVMGANPAVAFPDGALATEALDKVEFLVVQDLFLTPTAQQADVVLPSASFAEKEGTFTSGEGRVQRVRRAMEPLGEARPDWAILTELANRLGQAWSYLSPAEVAGEIAANVPLYASLSYQPLDLPVSPLRVDLDGKAGIFAKGAPASAVGATSRPSVAASEKEYPFVLHTGQFLYHSGTMSAWAPEMRAINAAAYVEIAPADAAKLGVANGDAVKLVSPSGATTLPAHLQPDALPGTLFVPIHFAEPAVNRLLDRRGAVDRVRVEKA